MKIEDFDFDDILVNEKSYENISYKTLTGAKPLRVRFNVFDVFNVRCTIGYDGTRYLVLFGGEKYDFTYNRIRYLIAVKSGITYVISHNYAKITVDSYDSLIFYNVIILIKSVFNKD